MKAGKIVAWIAGVSAVAVTAAWIWYRPKASITYDTKTLMGTASLGGKSQSFSLQPGATAQELTTFNGYRLGVYSDNGAASYTLSHYSTNLQQGTLLANGSGSSSYITLSVS